MCSPTRRRAIVVRFEEGWRTSNSFPSTCPCFMEESIPHSALLGPLFFVFPLPRIACFLVFFSFSFLTESSLQHEDCWTTHRKGKSMLISKCHPHRTIVCQHQILRRWNKLVRFNGPDLNAKSILKNYNNQSSNPFTTRQIPSLIRFSPKLINKPSFLSISVILLLFHGLRH